MADIEQPKKPKEEDEEMDEKTHRRLYFLDPN